MTNICLTHCIMYMTYNIFSLFFLYFLLKYWPNESMFQPPVIPRDSDGYVKSFIINDLNSTDATEAREFFEQYGFVVIANAFTLEQCKETISDIWNVIESLIGKQVRNDETLWTSKYDKIFLLLIYI